LFVSSPVRPQLGYFQSFAKTRRQGIELELSGRVENLRWNAAYTYLDATFRSGATLVNTSNSSSDDDGLYTIQSGDRIPGIPEHIFKASADYRIWRGLSIGGSVFAQSSQYVRGNENNQHQASGTDEDGRPYLNSGKVGGFAILNLRTSYQLESGLTVFGEIANVFDREYFTAGALGLNPFSPGTVGFVGANGFNYNTDEWTNVTAVSPGAPRAFWVGLSYTFGTGPRK
jgi:iron complex outermembrane recepter protein